MIWNDRSISIQSFEIQVFSNATLKEIVRLKVFDKKQYKLASDELLIELKENIVNQIESNMISRILSLDQHQYTTSFLGNLEPWHHRFLKN